MNLKKIKLYVDLIFCCVFLPVTIALVPVESWIERYPSFSFTLVMFLYAVYFTIRIVNIPQLVVQRKYVRCLSIIGALVFIAAMLSYFPFPDDMVSPARLYNKLQRYLRIQTVWFMFLVVSGYSLSISLMLELFREILVKKEIESQRDKAKLSLYKAQINPHFMFNTLNTLYGLTISRAANVESAFVKFTDMLKYTYAHADAEMIGIEREIEYIRNYIDLQSLRLNRHTAVEWHCEIDDGSVEIPPMLLVTLVENAFKYGVSSTRDCTISICASLKERTFTFSVTNNIMREKCGSEISVGLANCRARLDLLYPGRYLIKTDETDGIYSVMLKINL